MSLAEYLIKFSLGISLVYLFYRIFLYQHTFYNWNRFYLLGYSLLALVIPFINVTPWMDRRGINEIKFINKVPPVKDFIASASEEISLTGWLLLVFAAGMFIALGRLGLQFVSYLRMKKKSVMIHVEGNIRIYESNHPNTAFSFGNAIFINTDSHTSEELERIMLHEIVHVKHRHTIDLAVGELVCILNWFNPFAWKMRSAIKQNLEFIADANVLSRGHDRKQYQYLLLKVIGVPQYQIANHFNISDLKKRIAMMNKIKSARVHLVKFVFSVPLIAVILLAFRSKDSSNPVIVPADPLAVPYFFAQDTVPDEKVDPVAELARPLKIEKFNRKGYSLSLIHTENELLVLIREKKSNSIVVMTMDDWKKNRDQNEEKYGKLPSPVPPAPPVPPVPPKAPKAPVPTADEQNAIDALEKQLEADVNADYDVDVDAYVIEEQEIQALQHELANEQLKIEQEHQILKAEAAKIQAEQRKQKAVANQLKASKSKDKKLKPAKSR